MSQPFTLNLLGRKYTDVGAAITYLLVMFGTMGIAAYGGSKAHKNISLIFSDCNSQSVSHFLRGKPPPLADDPTDTLWPDMISAAPFSGVSLAMAIPLGITWMALLRYFARPVVYGTLITKGLIMICMGGFLYTQIKKGCGLLAGDCTASYYPLVLVALGLLYWLCLWCARSRIELTAALLEQAVKVVASHPGVFFASGCFLLVKLLFILLGVGAIFLTIFAELTITPNDPSPGFCDIEWESTTTNYIMYGVCVVFFYWSVQLWLSMRYYVCSLTTGVWYYKNASLAAQEASSQAQVPDGFGGAFAPESKEYVAKWPVCYAVRLALTKSFGTIAFASGLIAICEYLKRMANRSARNNGLIGCLIACCISCILSYLQFLTRFALTFHALTGDSFCESGRTFMDHCTRHGFTKVLVVDWMASLTLNFGAVVLGLLCTAGTVLTVDGAAKISDDNRVSILIIIGIVAWLIASLILLFIAGVLHDIVDAAYACLVLDLDHRQQTGVYHQPAIAQAILVKVQPGIVIEQPGGAPTVYAQPITSGTQPIQPIGVTVAP
jgi:hypothetical protein